MNRNDDIKLFKTQRCYLPKGVINNYNLIINGKNFYDQAIDSDIKRFKRIRKPARQGEDSTTGCLIFIRLWLYNDRYRLIAVDLSRQKELDADPKAIQQI